MAFIKNGNINSLFRNYIFANAKYKINIWQGVTTSLGLSIICIYSVDDVTEASSCPDELVLSFFHHLQQRALESPVIIYRLSNSNAIILFIEDW